MKQENSFAFLFVRRHSHCRVVLFHLCIVAHCKHLTVVVLLEIFFRGKLKFKRVCCGVDKFRD